MPTLSACCTSAPCANVAVGMAKAPKAQETSLGNEALPDAATKCRLLPSQPTSTPPTSLGCSPPDLLSKAVESSNAAARNRVADGYFQRPQIPLRSMIREQ